MPACLPVEVIAKASTAVLFHSTYRGAQSVVPPNTTFSECFQEMTLILLFEFVNDRAIGTDSDNLHALGERIFSKLTLRNQVV